MERWLQSLIGLLVFIMVLALTGPGEALAFAAGWVLAYLLIHIERLEGR